MDGGLGPGVGVDPSLRAGDTVSGGVGCTPCCGACADVCGVWGWPPPGRCCGVDSPSAFCGGGTSGGEGGEGRREGSSPHCCGTLGGKNSGEICIVSWCGVGCWDSGGESRPMRRRLSTMILSLYCMGLRLGRLVSLAPQVAVSIQVSSKAPRVRSLTCVTGTRHNLVDQCVYRMATLARIPIISARTLSGWKSPVETRSAKGKVVDIQQGVATKFTNTRGRYSWVLANAPNMILMRASWSCGPVGVLWKVISLDTEEGRTGRHIPLMSFQTTLEE